MPATNILVIRGGAIGDFVLTLPVLAALRRRFPDARLEVLGYPRVAALAVAGGLADAIHPIESGEFASLFAPAPQLPLHLEQFIARFAIMVSYLFDPVGIFERHVRQVSSAEFIRGPYRPDESQSLHATAALLKPLERLGIREADPIPRLDLAAGRRPGAKPTATGLNRHGTRLGAGGTFWLAAHPGSGSESKNWPEARWAAFLARLSGATDWHLLLVGGEAEGERVKRLAGVWPAARLEIARDRPLVELAARLGRCHQFVGHDSGITHLAAALGLPGVVLWGPSCAKVWRPCSERMALLRAPTGWDALPVERVLHACLSTTTQRGL